MFRQRIILHVVGHLMEAAILRSRDQPIVTTQFISITHYYC